MVEFFVGTKRRRWEGERVLCFMEEDEKELIREEKKEREENKTQS